MIINHNISALNTYNKLSANENAAAASLEKLSSGLRINKAADDAAGLAISQKMQAQINSLDQASSNAQDGISLIQTAEGGMSQIQSILQRMNELATESANGTQDGDNGTDRTALNAEFSSLKDEVDRIATSTQFNGKNLIDGTLQETAAGTVDGVAASSITTDLADISADHSGTVYTLAASYATNTLTIAATDDASTPKTYTFTADTTGLKFSSGTILDGDQAVTLTDATDGKKLTLTLTDGTDISADIAATNKTFTLTDKSLTLQVGASSKSNDQEKITVGDMRITSGTNANITALATADISTQANAQAALDTVKTAIDGVSSQRAQLGAYQNRLNYTISNLSTESQNLQSASSQITDVDMAKEMTEYTKNNILTQAANAMLAQANQLPQSVLSLLKS